MSDLAHMGERWFTLRIVFMGLVVACVVAGGMVWSGVAGAASIGVSGSSLTLNGTTAPVKGFVSYGIATDWGHNRGCGGQFSDSAMSDFFSTLPAGSVVRFDAFQGGLGVNPATGVVDWTGLDRVFNLAATHDVELIPVLANEWGGCDDGRFKNLSWFTGDYARLSPASLAATAGLPAPVMSYADWVSAVVNRYKNSPNLGMWEPIGEAEADTCPSAYWSNSCTGHRTCPNQATAMVALRSFFDAIGADIKGIDSTHPIEAGLLGGGQCGTAGTYYQSVGASSGLDVLSFHDYYGTNPFGGDMWNGVGVRVGQAATLGKPVIAGEDGILASSTGTAGCVDIPTRASQMEGKEASQLSNGVDGFIVWNFEPNPIAGCSYAVLSGDPLETGL